MSKVAKGKACCKQQSSDLKKVSKDLEEVGKGIAAVEASIEANNNRTVGC